MSSDRQIQFEAERPSGQGGGRARTKTWWSCFAVSTCSAPAKAAARACAAAARSSSTTSPSPVVSTLAILVDGASVATIEGLDANGRLEPGAGSVHRGRRVSVRLLHAGFILMTHQLLEANSDPDEAEIRDYLSGNLCRCARLSGNHQGGEIGRKKNTGPRNCLITKKVLHDHRNRRCSCCRSRDHGTARSHASSGTVLVATNLGWLFDGFENYALI